MPDWLDLILVAAIAVFGVSGYRQGFAAGLLSLTGFACGAAAGARAASGLSRMLMSAGPSRDFVAIAIAFGAAVTGMVLADGLAGSLRRLSGRPAGLVDSVGGAALNVTFLLVIAVLISSLAVGSPGVLSRQVDRSLVVRALDRVTPRRLVNSVRVSMVKGLHDVSGTDPAALPRPTSGVLHSPAAALARRGVVKVETVVRSCPPSELHVDGSGLIIAPGHVLTNAHVVAGLTRPPDVTTADGRTYQARVVLYDPRRDIAVLYVAGLRGTILHFTVSASYGAGAIVAGFPGGGPLRLAPATVGSSVTADITEASPSADTKLQVYPVRGQIQPGNSGGPLMAPSGRVYGIVFARSSVPEAGWALTVADVTGDAGAGTRLTAAVPSPALHRC